MLSMWEKIKRVRGNLGQEEEEEERVGGQGALQGENQPHLCVSIMVLCLAPPPAVPQVELGKSDSSLMTLSPASSLNSLWSQRA